MEPRHRATTTRRRGPRARRICTALAGLALAWLGLAATATAETPVALFESYIGRVNFVAAGGSLRTLPNTVDACAVGSSSSGTVAGIPAAAGIRAAYLYWAGSGSSVDALVALNGVPVAADRTFTATFVNAGTDFDFFGGFADVTPIVTGNGPVTFGGLTVETGGPHCASQAVLAGWGLFVVYEDPAEALRAVNVFDGFQFFRGSALTLTPTGFRVPSTGIDGRFGVLTFEGDPQNSTPLGGFGESLRFNGRVLDDGLVPPGSVPALQPFDGTIGPAGELDSYGVDVDVFDVSGDLSGGDTSAIAEFSAGGDLVLLAAEVISFTTEPFVDLALALSGDALVAGAPGTITLALRNDGPEPENTGVTVTAPLPPGVAFAGASGSGWSCAAGGSDLVCDYVLPLPGGTAANPVDLTFVADASSAPGFTLEATAASASADLVPDNDTAFTDVAVAVAALDDSAVAVVDTTGADVEPADTLRYTIRVEAAGGVPALDVAVAADLPALAGDWVLVDAPPGAVDASTGAGTGANGTGRLDIAGFDLPAGGTATIVLDVVVDGSAVAGDVIAFVADVASVSALPVLVAAPNMVVRASELATAGTKTLYVYGDGTADPNGFDTGPAPYLSRTPQGPGQATVAVDRNGAPALWRLTPGLQADLTISAGSVPVELLVSKQGGGGGAVPRELTVSLGWTGAGVGVVGAPVTLSFAAPPRGAPLPLVFDLPLPADVAIPAGAQLVLRVENSTPGGGRRRVLVHPTAGAARSAVSFETSTVINIDALRTYGAAWPDGTPDDSFAPGETTYVRATVSDPFGSFDISAVTADVTDPAGTVVAGDLALARVADDGAAQATFELAWTVPAGAVRGRWSVSVTAFEGTEGMVEHTRSVGFDVPAPGLVVLKTASTASDPVNGTAEPKAIPGAVIVYALSVANTGAGAVDAGSLVVTDVLAPETALYVGPGGNAAVVLTEGSPPSGLAFDPASDVAYSSAPGGGPPFDHAPSPDADGFDPAVTGLRITPGGALPGDDGGGAPAFTLRYRVRVD